MSTVSRLVSIKNPVLNALQDMGIDIAADVPVFTRWAAWAERYGIDSYYSYCKKIVVLDMVDCSAELPCDAAFVQAVVVGDFGCDCTDLFERFFNSISTLTGFSSDSTFLVLDSTDQNNAIQTKIKWYVQDGRLRFKTHHNDTKITVQYLGFDVDAQGFPKVLNSHMEAIVEYIMYKYCVRSKFSPQKMSDSDRQWHKREYDRLCIDARAEDAQISDSERLEIVSMLHNPFAGYGLPVNLF